MKAIFENGAGNTVIFTDEGIYHYGEVQDTFYPYGCLTDVRMGIMGVLQIEYRPTIVSFTPLKPDRTAVRAAVKEARERMKTAPAAEKKTFIKSFMVPDTLPPEEQVKKFRELYVRGVISKEEYNLRYNFLHRD